MSANARLTAIRELYESVGQGHVLKFFEALKPLEQVPHDSTFICSLTSGHVLVSFSQHAILWATSGDQS